MGGKTDLFDYAGGLLFGAIGTYWAEPENLKELAIVVIAMWFGVFLYWCTRLFFSKYKIVKKP